ncbi:hypothetical protein BJV78DRAFT_1224193 [Lactifluus subvellereus]|nr:hypothetical protein BJV78DRAFT_1224193 [Lactifluus subvellereus]
MAAFLKEMKTVRLRKVFNAPADMGRPPPPPRPSSAENSFIGAGIQRPPRPADGPVTIGEKRKREVDTHATEGVQSIKRRLMGPLPRSADTSVLSTNSSFSSDSQSQSQSQSQPEAGPSNPSRSYIPVRTWPSSSLDGTDVTPSLTSDGDAEQGPDEPSPPTPPQVPTVAIESPEEEEALPPPSPAKLVPRPPTPPRQTQQLSHSVFDKRPPRSPLPAPTPLKARPPTRSAARRRILEESDDEDDPLAIAVPDSPLAVRPRRERRPVATGAAAGASRHARRGSGSSTQSGAPSKTARRRTLDEELRNSDGVTEEDLLAFDIEPLVYSTVGSASRRGRGRKGFLAHGGGAGVPVFMGAGAVEGAEGDDGDDVEIIEPPPPPPPKKARGRTGGGTRRR